ncbi:TnsA endonuclease N-terminal domain-containing protein [Paenibacillus sp. DR312]|uniref:TnsA endonuclease N-terminal domain-containing protein n=1 Tax=Paenibacillus sp. DR312 TaxID=2871175 RepID=UPI001C96542C|nr:TnsA endonuclease N-terminal domain-containing protein [Paenibacillus sp. DR312]QZN75520.1 DDE-type integrase/transposase/recombinase [Paenibacillus sp. DR312]
MLTLEEFEQWIIKHDFQLNTINLINRIRSGEPSRRVSSSMKNVSGRYPSEKMNFSIQYESHRVELPYIYSIEHQDSVLEYYDQPNRILLNYLCTATGKQRKKSFQYTPDFFVIEEDGGKWVECKTDEELQKLSVKDPARYIMDSEGNWRCPPGEEYAKQFNLRFEVFNSKQINIVSHRNLVFLSAYFKNRTNLDKELSAKLYSHIESHEGLTLQELIWDASDFNATTDLIYSMIASKEIYVDLESYIIAESQYTNVFTSKEKALAYIEIKDLHLSPSTNNSSMICIQTGKYLSWDGNSWEILNHGEKNITLRHDNSIIDLTPIEIQSMAKLGKIKSITPDLELIENKVHEAFISASIHDCKVANERMEQIIPYLSDNSTQILEQPNRTIRHFIRKFKENKRLHGNGYIGLLPRHREKGNRTKRLSEDTEKMIEKSIKDYETFKQKNILIVYENFLKACTEEGIESCSYKTFVKRIHNRPKYQQVKKRKGVKAAYPFSSYYLNYKDFHVRHGDRPFEIAHLDHTEGDIEILDTQTGKNLGRPWVSILTDTCSRRVLAVYVTFDPPSYRSVMMILRECVSRFSRLPETIVVDGGKEFSSVYFETVLAAFNCGKKQRPAGNPRFGSVIERLFGTTNTRFIHNLQGNTQMSKEVRVMTAKNDPKKLAVWTLASFTEKLEKFLYDVYDETSHPALGGNSPREAYSMGMIASGERKWAFIPYDETFQILTMPTSNKGTAKVHPGRGFKNNYLHYWSESFRHPEVENKNVPIRYDPYNIGIAYAYVQNRWVMCMSDYYSVFNGRTEKQIKLAAKLIKQRNYNHSVNSLVNGKKLAELLRECDSEELQLQELKDQNLLQRKLQQENNNTTLPPLMAEEASQCNSLKDMIEQNHYGGISEKDLEERYGEF